jgi:hypothetical protein
MSDSYIRGMGRLTIRVPDEMEALIRERAGVKPVSEFLRDLVDRGLGTSSNEAGRWERHEKRLQALEDWQASALAPPLVRGGLCPPLEKQERTFVPDGQ